MRDGTNQSFGFLFSNYFLRCSQGYFEAFDPELVQIGDLCCVDFWVCVFCRKIESFWGRLLGFLRREIQILKSCFLAKGDLKDQVWERSGGTMKNPMLPVREVSLERNLSQLRFPTAMTLTDRLQAPGKSRGFQEPLILGSKKQKKRQLVFLFGDLNNKNWSFGSLGIVFMVTAEVLDEFTCGPGIMFVIFSFF